MPLTSQAWNCSLNPDTGATKFRQAQAAPSADGAPFIDHYWLVDWNLVGQESFLHESLPAPCMHLAIQEASSRIVGVAPAKYAYLLENSGKIVGARFHPGGFYPVVNQPAAAFTGLELPLATIFDVDTRELERAVFAHDTVHDRVNTLETWLRPHLPPPDPNVALVNQIIDRIIDDRAITRVDDVATAFAIHKRTLQRLFRTYVGVSPKWIIQRYRLHGATVQLAATPPDLAALALDLGYFDQAHFTNDFTALVGQTPATYANDLAPKPT